MKKFDFSKEFGNINPKYISEAEGEWKEDKKAWTPSFWSVKMNLYRSRKKLLKILKKEGKHL